MIIFYNESSKPYENQPYGDGLNKIIKSNKIEYANGRQVLRQCFISLMDDLVRNTSLDGLIEMEKPVALSGHRHQLVFGNRDLNPIAWALDSKDDYIKDKDIFIVTLNNSINSHFQLLTNNGYYLLEYSVSHGEFSVIFARDISNNPVEFEMIDLDTGITKIYSLNIKGTAIEFNTKNERIDENHPLYTLKKFRPAHPTKYIVTFSKDKLMKDNKIRIGNHDIMQMKDASDVDKVISIIKGNAIKAVTYYGEATEETKAVRDMLRNAFRIYYEMYNGEVKKVKVN